MSELTESSAKTLANLIKSKQVSCLEVMQAHLDRIAEVTPRINALVQVLPPELALQQARVADAIVRRDFASCGKLHGVPASIKDGRKVKGFMSTITVVIFCWHICLISESWSTMIGDHG